MVKTSSLASQRLAISVINFRTLFLKYLSAYLYRAVSGLARIIWNYLTPTLSYFHEKRFLCSRSPPSYHTPLAPLQREGSRALKLLACTCQPTRAKCCPRVPRCARAQAECWIANVHDEIYHVQRLSKSPRSAFSLMFSVPCS